MPRDAPPFPVSDSIEHSVAGHHQSLSAARSTIHPSWTSAVSANGRRLLCQWRVSWRTRDLLLLSAPLPDAAASWGRLGGGRLGGGDRVGVGSGGYRFAAGALVQGEWRRRPQRRPLPASPTALPRLGEEKRRVDDRPHRSMPASSASSRTARAPPRGGWAGGPILDQAPEAGRG